MKEIIVNKKYPVYELVVQKSETTCRNVDEIIFYLKNKIDSHKVAKFIAIFDNYKHTKSLGNQGFIVPEILDGKNLIFCFGKKIENALNFAIRPRSIGVVEEKDFFVLSFLEAPALSFNELMINWCKEIKNI